MEERAARQHLPDAENGDLRYHVGASGAAYCNRDIATSVLIRGYRTLCILQQSSTTCPSLVTSIMIPRSQRLRDTPQSESEISGTSSRLGSNLPSLPQPPPGMSSTSRKTPTDIKIFHSLDINHRQDILERWLLYTAFNRPSFDLDTYARPLGALGVIHCVPVQQALFRSRHIRKTSWSARCYTLRSRSTGHI